MRPAGKAVFAVGTVGIQRAYAGTCFEHCDDFASPVAHLPKRVIPPGPVRDSQSMQRYEECNERAEQA